jgi:hypothetical protein
MLWSSGLWCYIVQHVGTNVSEMHTIPCLEKFCRQYIPPKSWYHSTKLHTLTFQKITIFILTALATPNLMFCSVLCDGNITGSFICQEITGRAFILTNNKHKIEEIGIHIWDALLVYGTKRFNNSCRQTQSFIKSQKLKLRFTKHNTGASSRMWTLWSHLNWVRTYNEACENTMNNINPYAQRSLQNCMSYMNPPGLSANTVGLLCFGAGYRSCVISPSECIEWWCTSSARVLNLLSVVTYTCNKWQQHIRDLRFSQWWICN